MSEPGLLELTEHAETEVPASSAELRVVITGTRLFVGGSAWREAAEVRRLIEGLRHYGAGDNDVTLANVAVDVSKGVIAKSSSATYRLRVACHDLTRLPSYLDAVSDLKNARLEGVRWIFDGAEGKRLECMRRCVDQAKAKAAAIAEALGEPLGGVFRVQDAASIAPVRETAVPLGMPAPPMAMARARVSDELAGLDLRPSETVRVALKIVFRIGDATRSS
jgi:uncharacterized protein YggE